MTVNYARPFVPHTAQLGMKTGRAGTVTHDYKRRGTATRFAALNTLDLDLPAAPSVEELLNFLRLIDRKTIKGPTLHLVVHNYATHSHPEVQAWLAKHARFVMHFTPTGAASESGRALLPRLKDKRNPPRQLHQRARA